ncbi:MAG TPA: alpha/beta hydrolase [Gemmatimonadales bacterium]|nr:alpha/beta hydrolase [Gemmatimonadales bacterium]
MHEPSVRLAGQGPLLVFVPGMDGTGELFYRQVPSLARRYRVATYALRERAAMEELVADLAQVIASAAPERRATVVGESFGGTVALSFALTHPEMLDRLVILNSFPRFLPQGRLQLAIGILQALPFPWAVMSLVRRLTGFRLHSRHTHAQEVRRFLELTARTTRAGYLQRLRVLRDYDVRERLGEIQAPTLFLASDRDHLVPAVEQARYMAERVPRAQVHILRGHGHICLIAPDLDLAQILDEWTKVTA